MGQYEVLRILERNAKPMSRKEIAEAVKQSPNKVSMILKRLLIYGEVKFIELDRRKAWKNYGSKRRMRLYLLVKS